MSVARLSGGERHSMQGGMKPVSANSSREQATKISQRRVCDLVGVDPKIAQRERPSDHADIRKKMHEIASIRRRFGYPLPGR